MKLTYLDMLANLLFEGKNAFYDITGLFCDIFYDIFSLFYDTLVLFYDFRSIIYISQCGMNFCIVRGIALKGQTHGLIRCAVSSSDMIRL